MTAPPSSGPLGIRVVFVVDLGDHVEVRWLAKKFMQMRGWQFVSEPSLPPKFVAIGAPHTSNWDFVTFLAAASHIGVPARVIGKSSLVRWPFGKLMRRLGIIPLRRDAGQGIVEQMVGEFAATDAMALVIAPEGTRRRAEYWRSGFYRIAVAADVPIVLSFIDAENKRAGFGRSVQPSGDIDLDMDIIRDFYHGINGRHPENQGPIMLQEETT